MPLPLPRQKRRSHTATTLSLPPDATRTSSGDTASPQIASAWPRSLLTTPRTAPVHDDCFCDCQDDDGDDDDDDDDDELEEEEPLLHVRRSSWCTTPPREKKHVLGSRCAHAMVPTRWLLLEAAAAAQAEADAEAAVGQERGAKEQ